MAARDSVRNPMQVSAKASTSIFRACERVCEEASSLLKSLLENASIAGDVCSQGPLVSSVR